MEFSAVVEYVFCAVFAVTAVGFAVMTVELFREAVPTIPSDDRDGIAIG